MLVEAEGRELRQYLFRGMLGGEVCAKAIPALCEGVRLKVDGIFHRGLDHSFGDGPSWRRLCGGVG